MKSFMSICIAVCCALAIVSSSAFAGECPMGKGGFMSGHGKMACGMDKDKMFFKKAHMVLENADELGLASDQIEKVKALKYSVAKRTIKEDAEIETLALDIKEALGKDEVDINVVNKLVDQKYTLKAQKAKEEISAYADLKKILSPDQQKKVKEMCRKGMKGWGKGPGAGKGPMGEREERSE